MFLVYGGDEELVIKGYVDASFDTDLDDSKSQTGYMYILNGGAVSWCSCKQSVVARSTCEAEYMAALEAAQEAVWVKEFITDLGVIPNASGPMTLFCDNTGAIALAKEPRFHRKTGISSVASTPFVKMFKMDQSKKGFLLVLHGTRLSLAQCPTTAEDREKMSVVPYASAIGSICYAVYQT